MEMSKISNHLFIKKTKYNKNIYQQFRIVIKLLRWYISIFIQDNLSEIKNNYGLCNTPYLNVNIQNMWPFQNDHFFSPNILIAHITIGPSFVTTSKQEIKTDEDGKTNTSVRNVQGYINKFSALLASFI